ncbi:MAG TPA: Imm21 family immunity protein [Kofleriaceae bacterium]|jgi:hypothetical protein
MEKSILWRADHAALALGAPTAASEGGPFLLLSASAIPAWHGVANDAGEFVYGTSPCDYDRACDTRDDFLAVGAARAYISAMPDPTTLLALPDGAMLFHGSCDRDADLAVAALAMPDEDFATIGEFVHDGSELVLFDSALSHAMLAERADEGARIPLAAGTYDVSRCEEWDGEILNPDGETSRVMVEVTRLRRRA